MGLETLSLRGRLWVLRYLLYKGIFLINLAHFGANKESNILKIKIDIKFKIIYLVGSNFVYKPRLIFL